MKTKPKWAPARWAAVMLTLALGAAGCTAGGDANDVKFLGNVRGTGGGGGVCEYTVGEKFIGEGILDLAVTSRYQMAAALQNTMVASNSFTGANPNTRDTNAIIFDYATVQLASADPTAAGAWTKPAKPPAPAFYQVTTDADAPTQAKTGLPPTSWTTTMSGSLETGIAGTFPVDIVPAYGRDANGALSIPIGEQWQARFAAATSTANFRRDVYINLQIQFHGTTLSGSSITTTPITYPLRVCWGCLLHPVDQTGVGADVWQSCSKRDAGGEVAPCRLGQDDVSSCAYYCQICNPVTSPKYKTCDNTFCPQ